MKAWAVLSERPLTSSQQNRKVGRVYCYLTEEQAALLGASLEERKNFPNRKAILESLCILDDEETPPKQ